ncbi:MAG: GTPase ObgE [Gaiellales bacterium]|nr:GTPase ObgE [Gaiellales bacterium]
MFYDRAKINVTAGRGGNGCVSFRREKHVPRGGPDGGSGGDGGSIWMVADPGLRDLHRFTAQIHYRAGNGRHGEGANRQGARGEDVLISVPLGTQVLSLEEQVLADMTEPGQRMLVARGGRGGNGNSTFVSATRQVPRFAEYGEEGESQWLVLNLRLMADVGLAGLPNAGKSMLLRRISNAKPKVADYPFTTLEPMLGVVERPEEGLLYTVADIPGLLEGASEGVGLGHQFLAHLERCSLLLHVVDVTGYYGDAALDNFRVILGELDAHTPEFGRKPQLVALNKCDAVTEEVADERRAELLEELGRLRRAGHPAFSWELREEQPPLADLVMTVSAATGRGVASLVRRMGEVLSALPQPPAGATGQAGVDAVGVEEHAGGRDPQVELSAGGRHVVYRPRGRHAPFSVRLEEGVFVVEGEAVASLVRRTDLANEEAVRYLDMRLTRLGIDEALRQAGAVPGDEVRIAGYSFDFE